MRASDSRPEKTADNKPRKPHRTSVRPWQIDLVIASTAALGAYFHGEVGRYIKESVVSLHQAKTDGQATQFVGTLIQDAIEPVASFALVLGGSFVVVAFGLNGLIKLVRKMFAWDKEARAMQGAYQAVANTRTLQDLDWREFEHLIGQVFKDQGYRVQVGKGSQDKGIDITLVNDRNETLLVQCKHWKNTSVGVAVVREMAGAVQLHNAQRGAIVCSGRFTQGARQEAKQLGITLVDGRQVLSQVGGK